MRLLFLGDIVGRTGRNAVIDRLPDLRRSLDLDFVVANGENAAGGFGITADICDELFAAGVDVVSGGNHSFDQRAIQDHIDVETRLLRPANYPEGTPGRGFGLFESAKGHKVMVLNLLGRVFMEPLDDPFALAEKVVEQYPLGLAADFFLVDMHAEATSEKMAMGHFCDGRVSLVVGTHSHVPTGDAQVLPGGTAYQTDAGMCGDYDSVIGMEKTEPLNRFVRKIAQGRFQPAQGPATLCGVFVETGSDGLARRIEPVRTGGRLKESLPV